jgi:hypothetical protein
MYTNIFDVGKLLRLTIYDIGIEMVLEQYALQRFG